MRYKEIFTIYPRKLKNVTVFYYQCYDYNGKRTCGHSTGQKTKTGARKYCMNLYRNGKLIPDRKSVKFAVFSEGWWDIKTCKYLKWRQMQDPLAPSTIDHYKTGLELHINPFFGEMKVNTIDQEHIHEWIMHLSRNKYSNSSINILLAALKIMFKEAVRQKIISSSPAEKIKKLITQNSEIKILNTEEVQKLFPHNWREVWDSYEVYVFNKLAAFTGMRLGEIAGLHGEHVYPDHVHICRQYSEKYGLMPLKTKDSRNIPITDYLYSELITLAEINNNQFLFSDNGGKTPVSRRKIYKETGTAFDRIGINSDQRKKRRIALHHWRHFLNTALLMANVSTLKVQKVTGHKTLSMTRHYAHFDSREFTEVRDVQNSLLSFENLPDENSSTNS